MEDNSIQQKQQLLQTQIIDRNLNRDNFVRFCLQKRENGDDLNIWSVEELESVINEFVKQEEASNPKQANSEDVKTDSINNLEACDVGSKEFKEQVIQCRKLEKTELNGNKIYITVRNPKTVDSGLLSGQYVLYEVITEPFGWVVSRRYSDFDTLRKLLVKLFPGYNIPPLPNKKYGNRRFDSDFVMKRMKFLELFMNSMVENEEFKAHEIVYSFLNYEDHGKLEQKMKEWNSYNPSIYLEEFKTLSGQVTISHDENNEKYFMNIQKYFEIQTSVLTSLNKNLKNFYIHMNQATESLGKASANFNLLHSLNGKVLMKKTITKSYDEFSYFLNNWQKILIKQNELIKTHFKDFFKYINLEGQAYSTLIINREELRKNYVNVITNLNNKKEKLFATGDVNKFEIDKMDQTIDTNRIIHDKAYAFPLMCFNENKIMNQLYNQLGYVNKMNMHELKKMILRYVNKFVHNFESFNKDFYPCLNDGIGIWSEIEAFVKSIHEREQIKTKLQETQ